jgi:hypothetical protein
MVKAVATIARFNVFPAAKGEDFFKEPAAVRGCYKRDRGRSMLRTTTGPGGSLDRWSSRPDLKARETGVIGEPAGDVGPNPLKSLGSQK